MFEFKSNYIYICLANKSLFYRLKALIKKWELLKTLKMKNMPEMPMRKLRWESPIRLRMFHLGDNLNTWSTKLSMKMLLQVHVSFSWVATFPDNDRRNSLHTLHTMSSTLYQVTSTIVFLQVDTLLLNILAPPIHPLQFTVDAQITFLKLH